MDREKIDGWCEKAILALVLAVLIFSPLAIGAVRTWHWLTVEALTAAALALWMLRLWIHPRPRFLWPPICWAVLAFTAYAGVRYFQADIEYVARREVIRMLIYTLLFLIVVNNLHRQSAMLVLTLVPVFLGMLLAVYACFQFATKSDLVWNLHSNYLGRGSGTFIYPNSLAAYLEMTLPLALAYAVVGRLSHVTKILTGYAGVVMVAGVCASVSRAGLAVTVTLLALLSVVLLFQRGFRLQGLALAVLMLGAGAMILPQQETARRLMRTPEKGRAPDDMRYSIWQAGLEIWQDHLWLGDGPAHFDSVYPRYRPPKDQLDPDRVHNEYINLLTDWGIIGALLVASAWALLAAGIVKSWKYVQGTQNDFARRSSNRFALEIGAALGLVGILLHSIFDFNLHVPAVALWMVTLMALVSSQLRFATERYWSSARSTRKVLATGLMTAVLILLVVVGIRAGGEDYWLGRAALLPDFSVAQQAAFERAFVIEPLNPDTAWNIAECCRTRSILNESDDPDALARDAIHWYQRAIKLNPYSAENWAGCGQCLDWINAGDAASRAEADRDFSRADSLDPNGCYTAALIGRHFLNLGDPAAARSWLERSIRLEWTTNDLTRQYLTNAENQLTAAAARNRPPGPRGTIGDQPE